MTIIYINEQFLFLMKFRKYIEHNADEIKIGIHFRFFKYNFICYNKIFRI